MQIKKTIGSCLIAGACVAGSALAGGPGNFDVPTSGIYVDGNLGYAKTIVKRLTDNGVADDIGGTNLVDSSDGFAMNLNVGYQWNKYFAAEIGMFYLPKIKYSAVIESVINKPKSNNMYAFDVALKAMYPFLNDQFFVFAKLGAAYATIDTGDFNAAIDGEGSSADVGDLRLNGLTAIGAIGLGWNAYATQNMDISLNIQAFGILPLHKFSFDLDEAGDGDMAPEVDDVTLTVPGAWGGLAGVQVLFPM